MNLATGFGQPSQPTNWGGEIHRAHIWSDNLCLTMLEVYLLSSRVTSYYEKTSTSHYHRAALLHSAEARNRELYQSLSSFGGCIPEYRFDERIYRGTALSMLLCPLVSDVLMWILKVP